MPEVPWSERNTICMEDRLPQVCRFELSGITDK
jgi:hypothetical protein